MHCSLKHNLWSYRKVSGVVKGSIEINVNWNVPHVRTVFEINFFFGPKGFQVVELGMAFINVCAPLSLSRISLFLSRFLRFSRRRPIVLMVPDRGWIVFVMMTNVTHYRKIHIRSHFCVSMNFMRVAYVSMCVRECVFCVSVCIGRRKLLTKKKSCFASYFFIFFWLWYSSMQTF